MEIKRAYLFLLFQLLQLGAINAGKEKWHHTACVILPEAQPNLRWNFQAQPPDSSSPVRGNGPAVPRVRFGGWAVPSSRAAVPWGRSGLWHSFRSSFWAARAALPVATAPWDANSVICIIFFSAGHLCVCPVRVHKCTCAHSGTAESKLFSAGLNPVTSLAALLCCHDRTFSRRGGAAALRIHFLCSYHIGKGVGTRLQGC